MEYAKLLPPQFIRPQSHPCSTSTDTASPKRSEGDQYKYNFIFTYLQALELPVGLLGDMSPLLVFPQKIQILLLHAHNLAPTLTYMCQKVQEVCCHMASSTAHDFWQQAAELIIL